MSRVANSPVALPSGVEVKLSGQDISVKGAKGEMGFAIHELVELVQDESELTSVSYTHLTLPTISCV